MILLYKPSYIQIYYTGTCTLSHFYPLTVTLFGRKSVCCAATACLITFSVFFQNGVSRFGVVDCRPLTLRSATELNGNGP